jgi:hypothetical protein
VPAVTTEGLILKRRDFGEADRVLTVLTDRYGKISVIARGVRKITSRRAGNIEVLNRVKLHLFKAKSYTLSEAESLDTFRVLKENLTLSTTAFHIIEIVDRLTPEEQKNPQLYDLVVSTLKIMEDNPRQIFIRSFEVKILSLLGFWSERAVYDLNPEVKGLLEKLAYGSWTEIASIDIKEEQSIALEQVMRHYLEKVLESGLKSVKVLKDLKK